MLFFVAKLFILEIYKILKKLIRWIYEKIFSGNLHYDFNYNNGWNKVSLLRVYILQAKLTI